MPCFKQNVEEAHFTCPICRLRISSWARKQSRLNQLVDQERWKQIQDAFPLLCEKRLNGDEEDCDSEFEPESPVKKNVRVAEPGEIRKEFEEEVNKFQKIREEEEKQAIQKSEELIKKLQQEEIQRYEEQRKMLEVQRQKDEELAKCIAETIEEDDLIRKKQEEQTARDLELARRLQQLEKSPNPIVNVCTPSTSSQKGTIPVIKCARLEHLFNKMESKKLLAQSSSQRSTSSPEESSSQAQGSGAFSPASAVRLPSMEDVGIRTKRARSPESEDSITLEVSHFKPIETSPRTAHKRLADGSSSSPPIIHSTPRNLKNFKDSRRKHVSPVLKERLKGMVPRELEEASPLLDKEMNKKNSKETQVSLARTSRQNSDEENLSQTNGHKETIDLAEKKNDINEKRRKDIRTKLSKFSHKMRSVSDNEAEMSTRNEHTRENYKKQSETVPQKIRLESKGAKKSHAECLRNLPVESEESSNPLKRCKSDIKLKDKNANDITRNAREDKLCDILVECDVERKHKKICGGGDAIQNGTSQDEKTSFNCPKADGLHKDDLRTSDGQRTSNGQSTIVKYMELVSAEQKKLKQEEIDRRIALELQQKFEEESKTPIVPVVRTKGSEDEYPLRGNRKRSYREISPSPEG